MLTAVHAEGSIQQQQQNCTLLVSRDVFRSTANYELKYDFLLRQKQD